MAFPKKAMKFLRKSAFATKDQELLLRAALLKGTDAVEAWKEWKGAVDLEGQLDNGSFRLLPLLYMNLKRLDVKDPLMGKLKGIYLKAWYKNQRLFFEASKILDYLHNEGIQTMVLKGIPLAILYYKNCGVRPMSDIDVLVPTSQAFVAETALKRTGWSPAAKETSDVPMQYLHSQEFEGESGTELDLHWHPLFECARVDSGSDFWTKAVPLKIQGIPSYALDPTDMLFHVIVHGVRWNPEPPIRWIADAITILESSGEEIDWLRIISHAKKYMVCLQIKEGLSYLHKNFQAPVPTPVMDNIRKIPVSYLERLEYQCLTSEKHVDRETLLGGFPTYLLRYLRLTRDTGRLRAFMGFPKYLQYRTNKKSLRHLLSYLVSRGIRISKKKLASRLIYHDSGLNR